MKPFNLEAALNGARIIDRQGDPVELIAYVEKALTDSQVVALHSDGSVCTSNAEGQYWAPDASPRDLFMTSVKVTRWVNFYEAGKAEHFSTQESADWYAEPRRIGGKAHLIEFEE